MRSKWMRYSSSSASRSPCCPRSTSCRTWSREAASARAGAGLCFAEAITRWMPGSCDPEPHPRLAPEPAHVDDSAQRDDVRRLLRVERHRAFLTDPALERRGCLRTDEHAQRLSPVEADLDTHLVSYGTPPPRERRGPNLGGRRRPRVQTAPRAARRRPVPHPRASATRARRGCLTPRTPRGAFPGRARRGTAPPPCRRRAVSATPRVRSRRARPPLRRLARAQTRDARAQHRTGAYRFQALRPDR